jgi:hypothetical protein
MKGNTMKNKTISASAFLLAALLTVPASAQTRGEDDATPPKPLPSESIQKLVREQLARNLPGYDKGVLTSYETPNAWEDNLSHTYLNSLLNETPFDWEGRATPPPEADRLQDENKVMRIRRADGAFRYHSRKRVFSPEFKGKAVPSAERVTGQMAELLSKLAFPTSEGGKPVVKTQEVAVSGADNKIAETYHSYAWFNLGRTVAGLPVEGSTVRAAVNHRGEIQRLKVAWPHFKVRSNARLLSRENVAELAANKIFAHDPTERLQLAARMVYARSAKGDYLPAVQVDVTDGETPYRLTVPVAD